MRVVVQRSKAANVTIAGEQVGAIDKGLVLLVGITHEDTEQDLKWMADKLSGLRIFDDESGKMNLDITEAGGSILSVSQFTLYGDCRKGRRPSFMKAARPDHAEPMYHNFNELLRNKGIHVETGQFGAEMDVSLVNDGPITIIIDTEEK
ncbi:D-aminoacyl-tRNA deacylase [Paenibacillus endoradicis]|uniref:D-aminoacyl-tRNA deacylase n=1 Tax=Paenibacillus endoradicis TaxID=2972487 RepID=UPI002158CBA4|nr:D-aminoacyl-tRNA deacylase [Paenibacillus endoradicis]MCR8655750.1 D-aminoacyl-tRNA deacylase [Paenibacillus endoradicis]MCR8658076.1 D-aminoacyl-tRNA deacylase [Paenibacillus endoradicis]